MEFKLLNNTIIGSQDEKGNWIYKSNPDLKFLPFKKNGALKATYKDLPRYKAIVEYEQQEMKDFNNRIAEAVKDISLKLLSFSNQTQHGK